MEENAITVQNVTKFFRINKKKSFFGKNNYSRNSSKSNVFTVLDDISLTVQKGEMLGIIGLNGSGKTTLLRTIAGIYKPNSGSIKVNGKLAPILQIGTGFNLELNAAENISMYGMLLGLKKHELRQTTNTIIQFAELEEFAEMSVKNYSSGMKARLAFSTALQVNPDILLVDEILAVGDKSFKEKSFDAFLSFKKNRKTILYSTHSMDKISKLSDRVLLLNKGKLIMIGNPDEVIQKYDEIIKEKRKNRN